MIGRDHPRVCGEHRLPHMEPSTLWGSSPRMRGTPLHEAYIGGFMGIIPAYAGNTTSSAHCGAGNWDHPRVCGEHSEPEDLGESSPGSSPRMRGTRGVVEEPRHRGGIIPAYAGNTTTHRGKPRWPGDHPRVCGEHSIGSSPDGSGRGSSPRMRGTH